MKKKGQQKSTTGIGASLTPDYRDKEESNIQEPRTRAPFNYRVLGRCHRPVLGSPSLFGVAT